MREAALLGWPAFLGGRLGRSSWMLFEVLLGVAAVVLDHHSPVLLRDDQSGQELHLPCHVVVRGLDGVGDQQKTITVLREVA